ncbi:DNA recombination protein RmuC [Spongiibacter taiwanensis]|uniref:DNA recombination protein RmuC n=1 Tax=Spongiibacter taiwanensis TaxID=1748242 RepID=UPI0020355A24|nr:DNA recombination protein RmuC [Spongiibacter taiwanensis]USA43484.1 DNA recombination protein RmuC [Spongiibacter taiwanensis]
MTTSSGILLIAGAVALAIGFLAAWLLRGRVAGQQIAHAQQAAEALEQQLQQSRAETSARSHAEQQALQQLAALRSRDEAQSRQVATLEEQLQAVRQQCAELSIKLTQRDSEYQHLKTTSDEKITLLNDARKQLTEQFEQLANRIFDEKTQRFQRSSQDSLELSLKPFREQLKDFRTRVDHIYDSENRERGELREQLKSLQDMNRSISREAQNLTKALKGDNKAQGNWGEVILERVLEESGLHKGREYETQASFADESGRRRQPDVIVHLPEDKDIIIDAKVSLIAYERYCSAEDEAERAAALREHIQSVRQHVSGLSTKAYQHIEAIRSLDFVFIFIPIEAAFMAAFEHDPDLFRSAYEKNIIVVGPTTLLATLRTVQSIWRYERQNRNAEKIAAEAGALHDQFALVVESLEEIGKHLERGQGAYDKTLKRMTEGRGNLVGRVARLEALGAKVKKQLPSALVERADVDATDNDNPDEE